MTRVKVCGLATRRSVAAVVDAGVDLVGFNFWPGSKRHVTAAAAARLRQGLPPSIATVGLFVNQSTAAIADVLSTCPLDWLQFHGDEEPAECREPGLPFIKAFRLQGPASLARIGDYLDSDDSPYLVDAWDPSAVGGTGTPVRLDLARRARDAHRSRRGRLMLAGGLTPDTVSAAVQAIQPWAVDVASGVETAPGDKDPDLVVCFCRAARGEDMP